MTLKPPDTASLPTSSFVEVIRNAPINVEYPEYGASPTATEAVNRAAVQRAIDALPAAGGAIYTPRTYIANAPLVIPAGKTVHMFGAGRGASGIKNATTNVFEIGVGGGAAAFYMHLDGLTIE